MNLDSCDVTSFTTKKKVVFLSHNSFANSFMEAGSVGKFGDLKVSGALRLFVSSQLAELWDVEELLERKLSSRLRPSELLSHHRR